MNRRRHPSQRIVEENGVRRFQPNAVVCWLVEQVPHHKDLIAGQGFDDEDLRQYEMLLGSEVLPPTANSPQRAEGARAYIHGLSLKAAPVDANRSEWLDGYIIAQHQHLRDTREIQENILDLLMGDAPCTAADIATRLARRANQSQVHEALAAFYTLHLIYPLGMKLGSDDELTTLWMAVDAPRFPALFRDYWRGLGEHIDRWLPKILQHLPQEPISAGRLMRLVARSMTNDEARTFCRHWSQMVSHLYLQGDLDINETDGKIVLRRSPVRKLFA